MSLKKSFRTIGAIVAVGAMSAACGGTKVGGEDDGGEWPGGSVEFVIPTAAGGALDTTFRQVQPYIEEALGVPLAVEYREGGQFAIGTTYVANEGQNCEPFMFHAIPDIIFSYKTQKVSYTYDDFYPVAGLSVEPSTLWVQEDAPWETLDDFIEDARSRPGKITISVANLTNADHLAVVNLQDAADIEFNIVSYDGGGPARNALIAGEVDGAMGGVFAGQTIASEARALTVFQDENEWPGLTDKAPAVNDVLGLDIPPIGGSFGFFASKECHEEYPERFDKLADAVQKAVESPEYRAALAELSEESKLRYQTPEEYNTFIEGEIKEISALLEERPELFGK